MSARRVLFGLFPYAVFLMLTVVSWQRWIEPYVDTGRELMVPWRVANGEALYRDVRFLHGPLAPYLAAGIDALCGRRLWTRTLLAAVIALSHLEVLRRLAGRFLTVGRASLAAGGTVAVAFFLRPGGALFPFSFDASLAVAATAWSLYLAAGRGSRPRDWPAAGALAIAVLCRPEMGIAAIVVLAWEAGWSRRLWVLAGAPLAIGAVTYGVLSAGASVASLRREGWLAIIGPPEAFQNVYAAYAGFDRPALRLAELALAAVLAGLVATLLVAAAFLARTARPARPVLGVAIEIGALLLLTAVAAAVLRPPAGLLESIRLLPPLIRVVPALAIVAVLIRAAGRLSGRGNQDLLRAVPDAVLATAALYGCRLLLAAGYVGPYNAFLLPLPLLVVAVLLFSAVDRARASIGPALPRLLATALALFLVFRGAAQALLYRQPAWSRVETPAGSLYLLEPVATTTRLALADLRAHVPTGAAVVGFPEGGFFDYVLGFSNPLPQEQFFPGHLDANLEKETIRRLDRRPPDAVLLCNVLAVGFGARAFGSDYNRDLAGFLRERFAPAASYGPGAGPDARIGDPQFFVTVRVPRRTAPSAR